MAPEHGRFQVFVSSSMMELAEERSVVESILSQLEYDPYLYERDLDARATSQEEAFMEELSRSRLYVGIFWNKAGRWTLQELNAARDLKIPILLFVKKGEDAQRDPDLKRLLKEIRLDPKSLKAGWFQDKEELGSLVRSSVQGYIKERETGRQDAQRRAKGVADSSLLTCLCNRQPQETALGKNVEQYWREQRRSPMFVVLDGHKEESHGRYIDRVESQSMVQFMANVGMKGGKVHVQRIWKPISPDQSALDFQSSLRSAIGEACNLRPLTKEKVLFDHVQMKRYQALIVVLDWSGADQGKTKGSILEQVRQYLLQVRDVPAGFLYVVMVCLKYTEVVKEGGMRAKLRYWQERRSAKNGNKALQQDLERVRTHNDSHDHVHCVPLPSLQSPNEDDVDRWLKHPMVSPHVLRATETTERVRELFREQPAVPMEKLEKRLESLLITEH